MAIFVDHVGLNTLVSSSLDLTTNTIESNVNNAVASIPAEESLLVLIYIEMALMDILVGHNLEHLTIR